MSEINETYVVYLLGYPAVGKRTVGAEVAKLLDGVLIDNSLSFYPIFKVLKWDGKFKLPEGFWERVAPIQETILQTIENIAPLSISYVFTNCLEDTQESRDVYERVKAIASKRKSKFLAVMLTCDIDEQVSRINNPDRISRFKGSDPEGYRRYTLNKSLFQPTPNETITLDTTSNTPEKTAEIIVRELKTMER